MVAAAADVSAMTTVRAVALVPSTGLHALGRTLTPETPPPRS